MIPEPRASLQYLPPVAHGALDFAELEHLDLHPDRALDFSTNTNPYGPSPSVRQAIANVSLARYPDRQALALRRALASHLGQGIERILVGNGSAELIWLVALAYLREGDHTLVIGPTFGEYANAARIMGASVNEWRASPRTGFALQPDQIDRRLNTRLYRLVFLCNPNNPTGQTLSHNCLDHWTHAHPGTLFVVDEAYLSFMDGASPVIQLKKANLLILRSMTKDYALAGLRLGYAVGPAGIISALRKVQPPWSVNALAQAAGVAALQDQVYLQDCMVQIQRDKSALVRDLAEIGISPLPSAVHFFLLQVGDGARFRAALLQHALLVRDCASFGLPGFVRIATRKPEENRRLLQVLREVER